MSKTTAAFDDAASKEKRGAPSMSRSRGQLAASYAPGAFFTFEGGLLSILATCPHCGATRTPDSCITSASRRRSRATRVACACSVAEPARTAY